MVTKTISLNLRGYADQASCTVSVRYNGQEVFHTIAQAGESSVSVTLSGRGTMGFSIFINDVPAFDEWVEFN